MEDLETTRKALKSGDNQTIREVTGYSLNYISLVLNGKRKNERIVNLAKKIVEDREQLTETLKEQYKTI